MADSPEGPKVVDGRPLAVPSLERHVAIECARQRLIQDVDSNGDGLTLEVAQQVFVLQHAARHVHNALVAMLHHPILLGGVGGD